MTATDVLQFLREAYAKPGTDLYPMNDLQIALYVQRWSRLDADVLMAAAVRWIDTNRWFPAVSDLTAIVSPVLNEKAEAEIAWALFERTLTSVGAYRGVTFTGTAARLGEAVRQVFGSWEHACSYDRDSAGWHGRKQAFLAIYPTVRVDSAVTMMGLHPGTPAVVAALPGVPDVPALEAHADPVVGRSEAKQLLATLQNRLKAHDR